MHVSVLKKWNFFLNRDQILIYVYFTTISYILACYHLFIERRVTDNLYVIACVWLAWITFNCLAWRRNVMLHLYLKFFLCFFFQYNLNRYFTNRASWIKKIRYGILIALAQNGLGVERRWGGLGDRNLSVLSDWREKKNWHQVL